MGRVAAITGHQAAGAITRRNAVVEADGVGIKFDRQNRIPDIDNEAIDESILDGDQLFIRLKSGERFLIASHDLAPFVKTTAIADGKGTKRL